MNNHSRRATSSWKRRMVRVLGIALVVLTPASAAELQSMIDEYFSKLDAFMEKMADASEVKSRKLATTDAYFEKVSQDHPEFSALIRVNSDGKIISQTIEGEVPEKEYRDISNQGWFSETVGRSTPYYGRLRRGSDYLLFWAKPVIIGRRSVGAIAAKIELDRCFKRIAEKTSVPFRIQLGNKVLFSDAWKESFTPTTQAVVIKGLPELTLKTTKEVMAKKDTEKAAPGKAKETSDSTAGKKKAKTPLEVALGDSAASKGEGLSSHIVIPIIIILGLVGFLVVTGYLSNLSRKKNEALMKEVEKSTGNRSPPAAPAPPTRPDPPRRQRPTAPPTQPPAPRAPSAARNQQPDRAPSQPSPPPPPPAPDRSRSRPAGDQHQERAEIVEYVKNELEKKYSALLREQTESLRKGMEESVRVEVSRRMQLHNEEMLQLVESMSRTMEELEGAVAGRNRMLQGMVAKLKVKMQDLNNG